MAATLGLSVVSDDPMGDLEDLVEWLRQEPELRGHVRVVQPPPEAGHMGSAMELAIVAAGSGGVLTVLASSLKTWLGRPRKVPLELKFRRTGETTEIELSADRDVDLDAVFTQLRAFDKE